MPAEKKHLPYEGAALPRDFEIDLFPGLLCDQKKSGRCWIYASLAPFRQAIGIHFSTNYIYYFDQLRKADAFLSRIEAWRERDLSDPELSECLREPISTVGQWPYFASLVCAFGLVPLAAMPDTPASEDGLPLTSRLQEALRFGAWELRNGKADRGQILREVETILREALGDPPERFCYAGRTFTPMEFYRQSGIDLGDYVMLIHHPSERWPCPCVYCEDPAAEDPFLTLLSVEMETVRDLCLRQLRDGRQVVIGADVRRNASRSAGELRVKAPPRLSKRDAIAYRHINACHVMSIDGWAADGRWKVQDSHGTETGPDGHYVMTDAWFDAYVLSAVVRKEYLPPELLALLDAPAVYMPKNERF